MNDFLFWWWHPYFSLLCYKNQLLHSKRRSIQLTCSLSSYVRTTRRGSISSLGLQVFFDKHDKETNWQNWQIYFRWTLRNNRIQTTTSLFGDRVTSQISFQIISMIALSFVKFVLYILDSISIWTGLSVIGCDSIVIGKQLFKSAKSRLQVTRRQVLRILEWHQTRRLFSLCTAGQAVTIDNK